MENSLVCVCGRIRNDGSESFYCLLYALRIIPRRCTIAVLLGELPDRHREGPDTSVRTSIRIHTSVA